MIRIYKENLAFLIVLLCLLVSGSGYGQTYVDSIFVGRRMERGDADGIGSVARFRGVTGVATDNQNNVYVAEFPAYTNDTVGMGRVRKIMSNGTVSTLAGRNAGGYLDGTGANALFRGAVACDVDNQGNIYVVDSLDKRVRKVTPSGVVTTLAGSGRRGLADGQGTNASFNNLTDITVDNLGNCYVIDAPNRIRKITPTGLVTTIAGGGNRGFVDGPVASATIFGVNSICCDNAGNLYFTDDNKIRKLSVNGIVTTIAGNGIMEELDGIGTAAAFNIPNGIRIDRSNNLFVSQFAGGSIRKVTPSGVVSTIRFNTPILWPTSIDVDNNGNIFLAAFLEQYVVVLRTNCVTPPTPRISAGGPTTFCQGGGVSLFSNAPTGNLWSTGERTQSIRVTQSGTYTCVRIDDVCTSAVSNVITVTIQDSVATPIVVTDRSTLCNSENAYNFQGTAVQSPDCISGIRLTGFNQANALGYAWYRTRINLTNSFQLQFNANFGNRDNNGADGIMAIFQNDPRGQNAVGQTGGSLGMGGVTPSFGIEFDTYDNSVQGLGGDIAADHIAIEANGNVNNPLVNAVPATPSSSNIEDGQYHNVKIIWNAVTSNMSVYFDGNFRTSYIGDIVSRFFNNNPLVYWGFSATTGGQQNEQSICGAFFFYDNNLDGRPDQDNDYPVLTVSNPDTNATYTWSDHYQGTSEFASSLGTYSVRAIKGNCTSRVSNVVRITSSTPLAPIVTPSGPLTFCEGDSVVLTTNVVSGNIWNTGARTQSIVVRRSGTYTANQVDRACTSFTSLPIVVNVIPNPPPPVITTSRSPVICLGDSVVLTSSFLGRNTWSTGDTTRSIVVRTAGNYSVRGSTGSCQSLFSVPVQVTVIPPPVGPTLSIGGVTSFCQGGSVVLSSSLPNNNVWSNGATTQSITVTTSGRYYVRQQVATCRSANSDTVLVTVFPTPSRPIITPSRPVSFCAGDSTILVSSLGYRYLWSTGDTTQSIVTKNSGLYTVRVTDTNGCISPPSLGVTVTANPIPSLIAINVSGPLRFCQGGSVTLTPTVTYPRYIWSNGSTVAVQTITSSGSYWLRVISAAGCTSVATTPIEVIVDTLPSTPIIANLSPLAFCEDDSVTLEAPISTSYLWSNGANTRSIKVRGNGTYSLRVTNAQNCTSSVSATVNTLEYRKPRPVIEGTNIICPGLTGVVYRITPDTMRLAGYAWQVVGGAISGSANADTVVVDWGVVRRNDAKVKLVATNTHGCVSDTVSYAIRINPRLAPVIPVGDTVVCGNNLVRTYATTSTPRSVYTWEITGGNIVAPSNTASVVVAWNADPLTPKSIRYTETVNADTICQGTSPALSVRVSPRPDTALRVQGTKQFCGTQTNQRLSLAGYVGSAYRWNLPTGVVAIGATNGSSINLNYPNIGTFIISVLETSKDSCQGKVISDTINVYPIPVFSTGGAKTVCQESIISIGAPALLNLNYRWSPGNAVADSTQAQTTYLGVNTGNQQLRLIVENSITHCVDTDFVAITVLPKPLKPVIQIEGATTFCTGNTVQLSSLTRSGLKYAWSTGDTTQSIVVSTSQTVYLRTTNASNCTSDTSDTLRITVNPLPAKPTIIALTDTTLCKDSIFVLQAPLSTSYQWSTGDTTQTIRLLTPTSVSLIVGNTFGCLSPTSAVVNLANYNLTPPDLSGNNRWLCPNQFDGIVYQLAPNAGSSYKWNIEGGSLLADTGALVTANWRRGIGVTRKLLVTETTAKGCIGVAGTLDVRYDSLAIVPESGCLIGAYDIVIPNVITPDGNGLNDVLQVENLELYPNSKLQVFNRFGTLIYAQDNYQNNWGAEGLNGGLYYYLFTTQRGVTKKGWVQVLKD